MVVELDFQAFIKRVLDRDADRTFFDFEFDWQRGNGIFGCTTVGANQSACAELGAAEITRYDDHHVANIGPA